MAERQNDDDSFLPTSRVTRRYGVSKMFVERRLANDPTFPRPHYFGKRRFWKLAELRRWEAQQTERKAGRSDRA
jgi:hypothetical protein